MMKLQERIERFNKENDFVFKYNRFIRDVLHHDNSVASLRTDTVGDQVVAVLMSMDTRRKVAEITISVGDDFDDACHFFTDCNFFGEASSTGRYGVKTLVKIMELIRLHEEHLQSEAESWKIECQACDEKRARAYRRLTRYGYVADPDEDNEGLFIKVIA